MVGDYAGGDSFPLDRTAADALGRTQSRTLPSRMRLRPTGQGTGQLSEGCPADFDGQCMGCHTPEKKGGLDMTSYTLLAKGGKGASFLSPGSQKQMVTMVSGRSRRCREKGINSRPLKLNSEAMGGGGPRMIRQRGGEQIQPVVGPIPLSTPPYACRSYAITSRMGRRLPSPAITKCCCISQMAGHRRSSADRRR